MPTPDGTDPTADGDAHPDDVAAPPGQPVEGYPDWLIGVPGSGNLFGLVKVSAPGRYPYPYPGTIDCDSKLPNGQTVGDVVRATTDQINRRAAYGEDPVGMFADAMLQKGGPRDFKNYFGVKDPTGYLGAAGNFAYGAIASGVGIPKSLAEAGAGLYAGVNLKPDFHPWLEDAQAAKFLPAGYATNGCAVSGD